MIQSHIRTKGLRVLLGLAVVFCLAGTLLLAIDQRSVYAQCLSEQQGDSCSASYRLVGRLTSISGNSASLESIQAAHLPAAGPLIYVDFVEVEKEARRLLSKGLEMRKSISPYRDDNDFDTHLRKLDIRAGLVTDTNIYTGTTPYNPDPQIAQLSFAQIVNLVEADLTQARDLYAFLTVFAPEHRFRADNAYINNNGEESICGSTDKEDPNPKADPQEPTVLEPIIDWCNFRARLRQSVREVANVRMIVGQEFMVDALGVNFSGGFQGGEAFVREEVAQLRAARYQFEKAEQFLTNGLKVAVGNGCLISDFYTQTEWSLLSRAAERQGNTQYHIATRESYLGIDSAQSVPQAQAAAQRTFRQSANDAHIKLIGLAGLGAPAKQRCQIGERPDGDLVAEMALNQLETKRQSQEMAAGLNIFGFDVTMTPARPYLSSNPKTCDDQSVGDRGLWSEAWCSVERAKNLQIREEEKTRLFDTSQKELNDSLAKIRQGLDTAIDDVAGCLRSDFANDEELFACAEAQAIEARECWRLAAIPTENIPGLPAVETDGTKLDPPAKYPNFDACINSGNFNRQNDFDTALNAMRGDFLAWRTVSLSAANINKQIQNSSDANATVTKWLGVAGSAETAARVSQSVLDATGCGDGINIAKEISCVALGTANTVLQGVAGGLSTAAEIEIANAENEKEIKDLLLQMSELAIDAESARQAFYSTQSDVGGLVGYFNRTIGEAKRQRAYFAVSPANDPSFRIVRDSARLQFAAALEKAARISYLAARRAEYEFAGRLSGTNINQAAPFRISDIYRARTAQDIEEYLDNLATATSNLPGNSSSGILPIDLQVSIAKDVLQLTDDLLRSEGFTTPEAIETERTRRFRLWVSENTVRNRFTEPKDGKPVLRFNFSTSLLQGGLFSNVISQGYGNQWLLKLTQAGEIVPGRAEETNGVSVNLVSDETNLSHRTVVMTQGGVAHMKSLAGCIFDYRLIDPASLFGYQEWPASQPAESAVATFTASVNSPAAANKLFQIVTENGYRTSAFASRAISASDWEIIIFAGTPQTNLGLPDMDLQKLTDIQLNLSATYRSRTDSNSGPPDPVNCTRIDY